MNFRDMEYSGKIILGICEIKFNGIWDIETPNSIQASITLTGHPPVVTLSKHLSGRSRLPEHSKVMHNFYD